MYTIKHAADLTGIPVATLRAWERRYGVVTPRRTESGYRLYDGQDLRALIAMRDLVEAGWSPQQAAHEVERAVPAAPDVPAAPTGPTIPTGPTGDGGDGGDGEPGPTDGTVPPVGLPPSEEPPHTRARAPFSELVRAAADLDAVRLAELLDEWFSRGSFEAVVDTWLMPGLEEIGRAWADGRITVAGEHLVASAVHRRLATAYEAAARNPHGASVLVGMPPGARHELGILAFATAARRAGLTVTYLGADLPARDWTAAAAHHPPRFAVLSLPCADHLPGLNAVVTALAHDSPRTRIAVGGRYQDLAPAGVHRLGHDIAAAAEWLAQEVAASGR